LGLSAEVQLVYHSGFSLRYFEFFAWLYLGRRDC